jgi:hypothetical protein
MVMFRDSPAAHLLQAKSDNLNEADTVMRVSKVFEDVLGYSAMTEISRETNIKDKYVDLAIKLEASIRLLVEVKAAGTTLRDRHIEQAERYASEGNHRWVVLTNGTAWNLYRLTPSRRQRSVWPCCTARLSARTHMRRIGNIAWLSARDPLPSQFSRRTCCA